MTDNGGVTPGWANASRVGSVTINVLNVNEAPTISAAVYVLLRICFLFAASCLTRGGICFCRQRGLC